MKSVYKSLLAVLVCSAGLAYPVAQAPNVRRAHCRGAW
jgi:hypothetical protein